MLITKNKSHRKILNNKGPITDPFGTPNKIYVSRSHRRAVSLSTVRGKDS